jgi:dolichol-phosphate mannosyltransferase
VIIIDADLQDPPEVIPAMLEKWHEGYDVVYGVRSSRAGESWFKLFTAGLFYRLINWVSDTSIPMDTGDFRLMSRRAVDALLAMGETHRLLRGMSSWIGFRQYGLEYERSARHAGTTKYPLRKMLNLALDGVLSFSAVPLRLVSLVGLLAALGAFAGITYAFILRVFTSIWVPGWTLMFIGMLLLGSFQLISLGVLGEYLGRVYTEAKHRPLFLVQEILERSSADPEAESLVLRAQA